MRDVAGEAGLDDRARDGRPVHFLRVVELVAAGDAAGMVVRDVLMVRADRRDQIAFHDLHVVDVVEQLHARRVDRLHHRHPE